MLSSTWESMPVTCPPPAARHLAGPGRYLRDVWRARGTRKGMGNPQGRLGCSLGEDTDSSVHRHSPRRSLSSKLFHSAVASPRRLGRPKEATQVAQIQRAESQLHYDTLRTAIEKISPGLLTQRQAVLLQKALAGLCWCEKKKQHVFLEHTKLLFL
jgi:hypothetical protein